MKPLFLAVTLLVSMLNLQNARAQEIAIETAANPQKMKAAPIPDASVADAFEIMMKAIEENDYVGFLSVTDDNFRAALTKPMFASVVAQIAPRQKSGYDSDYLGALKRQGFGVNFWKITFQNGGDDVLAEMSFKDGKVGGFMLR